MKWPSLKGKFVTMNLNEKTVAKLTLNKMPWNEMILNEMTFVEMPLNKMKIFLTFDEKHSINMCDYFDIYRHDSLWNGICWNTFW